MTGTIALRSESYTFPATGQSFRLVTIDGEPWLVASDVCGVLGYAHTASALRLLDEDERQTIDIGRSEGVLPEHITADSRVQRMTVISEPGFYSLTVRSQVPGAVAFRRWVTHEVLPAIRKTGGYGLAPQPALPDISTPQGLIALTEMFRDTAIELARSKERVAELEPAAEAWEILASAEGDYSLREAALILDRQPGISTGQNLLMQYLRDEGLVDRRSIPYARYRRYLVQRAVSYTHPKTGERVAKTQIRITADGLAYLRNRLTGRSAPVPGQLMLVPGASA
jgi:anti-repressor protein